MGSPLSCVREGMTLGAPEKFSFTQNENHPSLLEKERVAFTGRKDLADVH